MNNNITNTSSYPDIGQWGFLGEADIVLSRENRNGSPQVLRVGAICS